jgi:thiol-disulfide isomerase/thioredoxin
MSNKFVLPAKAALCAVFVLLISVVGFAQAKKPKATPKKPAVAGPKVTQIDIEGLRALIKPKGKPLLINFWATWCDPCREEFPDLVKIDAEYKGKIDVITVSLDDLADIATVVPKFLNEVKATMPAYLLKTPDESAAITMVAKDWSGNLPMTALYTATGEMAYVRMGKFTHEKLTEEIEKVLGTVTATPPIK